MLTLNPPRRRARRAALGARAPVALALVLVLAATGCSAGAQAEPGPAADPSVSASSAAPSTAPPASPVDPACRSVLVAAGDIVNDVTIADSTGRLAAAQDPDHVLLLGDNQYPDGSLEDYKTEYDRTSWGALKPITRPVPGNHEYHTEGAEGYFTYFDNPPPYYAYDAGCGWRGYALNSEIDPEPQVRWLRDELAAHPDAPVVATWHQPRWSSGTKHGEEEDVQPFLTALSGRNGVVLNGHEHNYERFAPVNGLRAFVVGTGGRSSYPFGDPVQGSERRIDGTSGVLRLELAPDGVYRWAFLDTAGATLDTGTG